MSKTATIRDVAALARVSVGTVSNHLTGKRNVSDDVRGRIGHAIEKLRFVPNTAVRVVRGERTPAVGMVVPDAANPFFVEVARGVDDVALDLGMVLIICNSSGSVEREKTYVRMLSELRVHGLLVTPVSADTEHVLAFEQAGGEALLLDEPMRRSSLRTIEVDDFTGGSTVAEHLLELGHRDLVFIGGPGGGSPVEQRYQGARTAIAAIDGARLRRIDAEGNSPLERAAMGDALLNLSPRPTAALCANDLLALAVLGQLQRRGVRVPDEVAITGYDDIEAAELASVPLTSIRQPQYDLGHHAARILLRLDEPQSDGIVFNPELVVRESTDSGHVS